MVLPVASGFQTSAQAQPSLALGTSGTKAGIVKDAYDLTFDHVLNSKGILYNFVTRTPSNPDHNAKTVVMQRFQYLADAGNEANVTLSETADVTASAVPTPLDVTVTAAEYGRLIAYTEFFDDIAMVPFDRYLAGLLADDAAKFLDNLTQTTIVAGKGTANTGDLGIRVVDGGVTTKVTSANLATAEALLTPADILSNDNVRDIAIGFLEKDVPTWDGQNYVGVAHPRVIADLREEAGVGGWRSAKEYMNDPALKLLPNEYGIFEGVRLVSNNRVRQGTGASTAKTYRTYWFGRDALVKHAFRAPTTVIAPQTDGLRRFFGLGWKATLGLSIYEPKAIEVTSTSSSRG
jgi:N4-gp56 family major capsid protein